MRIIAMYLPQFHRVKENDAWWGEGFTEWTAVRQAVPLFSGHNQPNKPYAGNYYDLMDKKTMLWQAKLMRDYGLDGAVFYHYYFKDGRRILEKPAENLLSWKDVKMPFCFSWANEPWIRSWSNLTDGNPWSELIDQQREHMQGDSGILLEQNYGGREEWEAHFRYLLPFFQDQRYIRVEDRPVFMFYKPQSIGCLREMAECWRQMAMEACLSGLYLMAANATANERRFLDEVYVQQPQEAMFSLTGAGGYKNEQGVAHYLDYDVVWGRILGRQGVEDKLSLGGFTGYDDSPRRGYRSVVIHGKTPDKFQGYLTRLLHQAEQRGSSFVILNAWNEWGEGMYLEPDEAEGYAYLEAVREARKQAEKTDGIDEESNSSLHTLQEENSALRSQIARYRSFWQLLHSLLKVQEQHFCLADWLRQQGWTRIAVYGLGMVGKHLATLLQQQGLVPVFGVDQSRNAVSNTFPVLALEDTLPAADILIVTVTYDFARIQERATLKLNCPIVSLKALLDELPLG